MSIVFEKLSHVYMPGSPFETVALKDVSITIDDGEFVGLIGHTGSGKTTLVQHINALLKPTEGKVYVNGIDVNDDKKILKELRKKVGLVFQYPEHQLFEETVEKDIAYGPKNLGMNKEETALCVEEAMQLVGLEADTKLRSPFELSGGQRRRVALAGVLAMNPEILILDEPTAGLDPGGRREMLALLEKMHKREKMTIIMISHYMDEIAEACTKVLVMENGMPVMYDAPKKVFMESTMLGGMGLDVPVAKKLLSALQNCGLDVPQEILTLDEMHGYIVKKLGVAQMLKNITLGQFFPGNSVLHRMDPRVKIILVLLFIVLIFFVKTFYGYIAIAAFVALLIMSTKVPIKYILRGLKPIFFIVILTFVLNTLMTPGESPLLKWKFINITKEGLKNASFLSIRLILLVIGSQLLTLTTSPLGLTDGIERLATPLSKIGFPAHEMAMMMTIALRFIPTLLTETDRIMKAQISRGADFETGNLMQKAKSLVPLLVPLFVSAFRRADDLALAMEARCYQGGTGRTRMKVLKTSKYDLYGAAVFLVLVAAIVAENIWLV